MDDFFRGVESPGMIDWPSMPTYNTLMAVAAGAALIGLAMFFREVRSNSGKTAVRVDGYAMAFGALGLILTTTGLHMTTTWAPAGPLAVSPTTM